MTCPVENIVSAEQTKPYYCGVRPCGCVTAMLADGPNATAKEIADFARSMSKTKRRVEHRNLTHDQFMANWSPCKCGTGANACAQGPDCREVKPNE